MQEAPREKTPREIGREKLQKFMKEECVPVEGIFRNYECAGGCVSVTQSKYPGQPMFSKIMFDGMKYTVPLWVARWLNGIDVTAEKLDGKIGSCGYKTHQYQVQTTLESGGMTPQVIEGPAKRRYGFQGMEFAG